jgi:STAM-binding protein
MMTDEMELFEVQMAESIITIGWIHTHPQYDVFLSSIDLHNQLGYQAQLNEAIAIVYSPCIGQPPYNTFRVKDSQK